METYKTPMTLMVKDVAQMEHGDDEGITYFYNSDGRVLAVVYDAGFCLATEGVERVVS